jgi:hypothetical protein
MVREGRQRTRLQRLRLWWLVAGDRRVVTALFVAAASLGSYALATRGLVYVGPGSYLPSSISSGVVAGLATLVTVTLSVNQLILSRVLASPDTLRERLEGTMEFRRTAESLTGDAVAPNDPATFLAHIGEALEDRVARLDEEAGRDVDGGFDGFVEDLYDYADRLQEASEGDTTVSVLSRLLGSAYARQLSAVQRFETELETDSPAASPATSALDDAYELLKLVAIVRQFLKTLVIQQDLARLSKRLAYLGFVGLAAAFTTLQLYTHTPAVTVPTSWLPVVAAGFFAAVSAPLALLVAYILRLATVAHYTGSVGPFVLPEERLADD